MFDDEFDHKLVFDKHVPSEPVPLTIQNIVSEQCKLEIPLYFFEENKKSKIRQALVATPKLLLWSPLEQLLPVHKYKESHDSSIKCTLSDPVKEIDSYFDEVSEYIRDVEISFYKEKHPRWILFFTLSTLKCSLKLIEESTIFNGHTHRLKFEKFYEYNPKSIPELVPDDKLSAMIIYNEIITKLKT